MTSKTMPAEKAHVDAAPVDAVPFDALLRGDASASVERLLDITPRPALSALAIGQLIDSLVARLSEVVSPCLADLFCGGRTIRDVVLTHLDAGTDPGESTAAHRRFCDDMTRSDLAPVFERFPVIRRLLATARANWIAATTEMLQRIEDDRDLLASAFGTDVRTPIASFQLDLSDPHNGGRRVAIIEWRSGQRVVYKPRDLRLEALYHDVVAELAGSTSSSGLRSLTVAPVGDTHGYVEWIDHRPCHSDDEMAAFYANAGRTLAILYFLGASDCHFENLVAHRDQLVLIDAETLFEGTLAVDGTPGAAPEQTAATWLRTSVQRTGMLPSWVPLGRRGDTSDLSALGVEPSARQHWDVAGWCFANTDDMAWGPIEQTVRHPSCLPVRAGERLRVGEFAAAVATGFREMYRTISGPMADRVASRLRSAAGLRRRVVLRPTYTYVQLQAEALGPDALTASAGRMRTLEKLACSYRTEDPRAWRRPLLLAEIRAMEALDVPIFEQVLGQRDIVLESGEVIAACLEVDGLTEAIDRVRSAGAEDLARQLRIIRGSISARCSELDVAVPPTGDRRTTLDPVHGTVPLADSSAAIARSIIEWSTPADDGGLDWLSANAVDSGRLQLGLAGWNLYDGRTGIAAFLLEAGQIEAGMRCLAPFCALLIGDDQRATARLVRDEGLGLLGIGGYLRVLLYLADHHPELGDWLAIAQRLASAVTPDVVRADLGLDLLRGSAGLVGPLARLARATDDASLRARIGEIGSHLVRRQDSSTGGWVLGRSTAPLTGLSHGASGMAVALVAAWSITERDDLLRAAAAAVGYERSVFDRHAGNWPDHRRRGEYPGPTPRYMCSWCHGAPGVALARLRLLDIAPGHDDAQLWREDLDAACATTIATPPVAVNHLCCGNLGRAAILGAIGERTNDEALLRASRTTQADALADAQRRGHHAVLGLHCDPGDLAPGLMTGLAGLGMVLAHPHDHGWVHDLLI